MRSAQKEKINRLMQGMRYSEALKLLRAWASSNRDRDTYYFVALCLDQLACISISKNTMRSYRNRAKGWVEKGLNLWPMDAGLLHVRGIIFLHQGGYERALADFKVAYRIRHKAAYLVSVANALRKLKKYSQALALYKRAMLDKKLSRGMLYHNIALTYQEAGFPGKAQRMAKQGLDALKRKKQTAFICALETQLSLFTKNPAFPPVGRQVAKGGVERQRSVP